MKPARVARLRRIAPAAVWIVLWGLLLPTTLAAHVGEVVEPGTLWRNWTLDPWVVAGILGSAWLYLRGVRRLWARAGVGRGVRRWQVRAYGAGLGALFVALISPLDAFGGTLFSAHMLQHMVLMLVAAPLLALGAPLIPFVWALPMRSRQRLGEWVRNPGARMVWRALTRPMGAWLIHAAAVWVWHAPVLYQATLTSEAVHIAQHISFFGTALLFWWAALEFSQRRQRRFGFGVLYIFSTAVHSSILGALLTFSLVLWYPVYAGSTGLWGLTPIEDQQLGGLIMWVPAGIVYVVAALALLAAMLNGRPQQARQWTDGWPGLPAAPIGSGHAVTLGPSQRLQSAGQGSEPRSAVNGGELYADS